MPLISYIGFAIVVILLIAFLAWAFEEPAGGVIMIVVGIIYFMTGWSHTFGIIAGICGICAYVHAKNKKKKDEVASKNEFCICDQSWRRCCPWSLGAGRSNLQVQHIVSMPE